MGMHRDLAQISNEIEFSLDGISAAQIIENSQLPLMHEVNNRDIIEMNVSLANNPDELNSDLARLTRQLIQEVNSLGGRVYAGSSVLSNTSELEPKWARTTSISRTLGKGFMDIASQQLVLGISGTDYAIELYNFFSKINPVLVALTASSPYAHNCTKVVDSGMMSRRHQQYAEMMRFFPEQFWNGPALRNLAEYRVHLSDISNTVLKMLMNDEFDANWPELQRVRQNDAGQYTHFPFDILEPHQIYWTVRVRPDHNNRHAGGPSDLSLELRVPDLPTSVGRMQALNSLVAGLAYYIADHGTPEIGLTGSQEEIMNASRYGTSTEIAGQQIKDHASLLRGYARTGLEERDCSTRGLDTIESILAQGNDAERMRKHVAPRREDLLQYLCSQLKEGDA